jgi:C4-dicarboxylate-specific signal transduction histidine kinase
MSMLLLIKNRVILDRNVRSLMIDSFVFSGFTEFSFTLYHDVYGLLNLMGHFFKVISFYLVYRAIIFTSLVKPQSLLFRNLQINKESLQKGHDELENRVQEHTLELRNTLEKLTLEVEERRKAEAALSKNADQLEARNRELQEFTFIASHDLQEPLRKIQIFSDISKIK